MVRHVSIIFLGVLFVLGGLYASPQTGIQGKVFDANTREPLVGVTVFVNGGIVQLSTDENGIFQYIGVPAGSYQLQLSLLGYPTVVLSDVRVSYGKITELLVPLTPGGSDTITVPVKENPTVTNGETVFTFDELQTSPRRGIAAHQALANGVVFQDDQFHIMGSRNEEVGYYVNGQWAGDIVQGGMVLPVIQEAIEEIQVRPFTQGEGYDLTTGGAVNTELKTGGERFHASLDYHTDRFANEGKQFLGTYSYGWQNITLTASGPVATNRLRYFVAYENTSRKDRLVRFGKGFQISGLVDKNPANPENWENNTFVGGDTVSIHFPDGFTPHNSLTRHRVNGTLVYLGQKFNIRSHVLFQSQKTDMDADPWFNILNDRYPYNQSNAFLWSGKFSHRLTSRLNYQIQLNFFNSMTERGDSYLGTDWQSWYDSVAVARATNGEVRYRNRGLPQYDYYLAGFFFNRRGDVSNFYFKRQQQYIGGSLNLQWSPSSKHRIQFNADVRRYTLRYFEINPRVMLLALPRDPNYSTSHGLPLSYGSIDSIPVNLWMINGMPYGYGYDIYGNSINSDKHYADGIYALGAPHPMFASVAVRDHWKIEDRLWLDVELRYDYLNPDQYRFKNPENPQVNDFRMVDYNELVKANPFHEFSPRIAVAFQRENGDLFYLNYGRFVQMPRLSEGLFMPMQSYFGFGYPNDQIWSLSLKPIKSNKIFVGYQHQFSQLGILGINVFYRNTTGLTRVNVVSNPDNNPLYYRYSNSAESISKGVQLSLETPRMHGFRGRLLYTYSVSTGNASYADSYLNQLYLNKPVPEEFYPLDYHQAHRGTIWLNYATGSGNRWKILNNISVSALYRFNSGHPYTRMSYPTGLSTHTAGITFGLFGYPVDFQEDVNASRTPWNTQLDLRLDKTFHLSRGVAVTVYTRILNALNTRNVINVYPATGSDRDDGVINRTEYKNWLNEYGPQFDALYRAIKIENGGSYFTYLGKELWGHPRQIFIGFTINY